MQKKKKIILLGASGQLGMDIQLVFSDSSKYEIIPLYRKDLNLELCHQINQKLCLFSNCDYLINCAAFTQTSQCEKEIEKAFKLNSISVLELAKFCQEHGLTFFHISTDYVFSGKKNQPYNEEDETSPLNVYGNSKLSGEQFIKAVHDKYFIFRVSSLYGRHGNKFNAKNFVESMLSKAHAREELLIVNDQIMSPTHTLDVAWAIERFIDLEHDGYGIYHCSGEGQCSWYEFAHEICKQSKLDASVTPIHSSHYPSIVKRPMYSVLDNTKINRIYPMKHWKVSLIEYLSLLKCDFH
jgi:dTDP-4-dehydrorhamnose reductase